MITQIKNKKEVFEKQLVYGEEGEKIIEEYLTRKEGRVCMALRQFEPKSAPVLSTFNGKIKSPDIISFKGSQAVFVECKRKDNWVVGNYSVFESGIETGVDARLYQHYRNLVQTTFIPVEIYFIQEKVEPMGVWKITLTNELIKQSIQNPNLFRNGVMKKSGNMVSMVFFAYELLEKIDVL